MRDFHPVHYTVTVTKYSNHHARYNQSQHTRIRRNLADRLNVSRCILPHIRHCSHSHSSQWSSKPAYPHPQSRNLCDHSKSTANASYRKQSHIEAVVIATSGCVYTSINGFWLSQHPSIWSLRHDVSCVCNGQTAGAIHVEQTAVDISKQLGDGKLCNATCFERISWIPTLADNRDILEHRYSAKQHLVHSIRGTHKGDLERGMLKQQPTVEITHSNWYQVRAEVDTVKSHFILSARDNIAELYDIHRFESNAEHYNLHRSESDAEPFEFIDSLLADNEYLFPAAERAEGGVHSPNPMQRESKAANEQPASSLLHRGSNSSVSLDPILSSGE